MPMENEQIEPENDLDPDAQAALEAGEIDVADNSDDMDSYGPRVQKRISKEVSKRKALEDRLNAVETEKERYARELKEARDKLSSYEKDADEGLDKREAELKARRDAALEQGELTTYNELNDELDEVKWQKRKRAERPVQPEPEHGTREATQRPEIAPAAQAWIDRNSDWLQSDEDRKIAAAKIEKQLVAEGYTYQDPETYKELDRRLASYGSEEAGFEDEVPATPRGATSGVPRDTSSNIPRNRKGVLTRDDLSRMKRAGFDPSDPSHRKAWLDRNKPL
jgi:hypothetical protein